MTPVTVITGFLGSGKTTLLSHLLRQSATRRAAVIVNEFADIAVDHDLLKTVREDVIELVNGCICCKARAGIPLMLVELAARRATGEIPPFEEVFVETTGLAAPAPILHALLADRAVAELYSLGNIITMVDAVNGLRIFDRYKEAILQVVAADRLIITKTDIVEVVPDVLLQRLRCLNREARLLHAQHGVVDVMEVLACDRQRDWLQRRSRDNDLYACDSHSAEFESYCIVRDEPLHTATLSQFLAALADNLGPHLLRLKGIVNVLEDLSRPAVVHAVQDVYCEHKWLERWPSSDRRTRIVLIGTRLPRQWISDLLDLLEAEVAEEALEIQRANAFPVDSARQL